MPKVLAPLKARCKSRNKRLFLHGWPANIFYSSSINSMEDRMASLKKTARLAGMLYLVIVLASVYGHMYVPLRIFVTGGAAATANNILANEFLFRTCIVAGLIETTAFLLLALALYHLLKDVNGRQAKLMAALMIVQVPVALVFAVVKFMALMTLKSAAPGIIPAGGLPGVAMIFLNIIRNGSAVLGIFSALWWFPLGMLLFRARFIPKALGVLLITSGAGSLAYSLVSVLFPGYSQTPLPEFIFFVLGEIPVMLWLLTKGVKDHISISVIAERHTSSRAFPSVAQEPVTGNTA
jgi:hypothetical protein